LSVLVFCLNLCDSEVHNCCVGSLRSDNQYPPGYEPVTQHECADDVADKCIADTQTSSGVTETVYRCGNASATGTITCSSDYCNCPPQARKSVSQVQANIGNMRSIMFPVMGIVFGLLWVVLAFLGAAIPATLLLLIVGLIDAVFGVFLIFLPVTAFLGLLYIALGAFKIAAARHFVGEKGFWFLVILTLITFFLTGGLTVIAWHGTMVADFVSRISDSVLTCERDLNIVDSDNEYWGVSTRCENYALFVVFCVFLLFLIQPIALLAAFFHRHKVRTHAKAEVTHTTVHTHQHTTPPS